MFIQGLFQGSQFTCQEDYSVSISLRNSNLSFYIISQCMLRMRGRISACSFVIHVNGTAISNLVVN